MHNHIMQTQSPFCHSAGHMHKDTNRNYIEPVCFYNQDKEIFNVFILQ